MGNASELMYKYNEQVASGKLFSSYSGNPSQAAASTRLKSTLAANETYIDTNNVAADWLAANETAFSQLIKISKTAYNDAMEGQGDTLSDDERKALGTEIDSLITEAVDIINTQHNGKYLFSGSQINTKSIELINTTNASGNTVTSVVYHGDHGVITQNISTGQSIATNLNADDTFTKFLKSMISTRDALLKNDTNELNTAIADLQNATDTVKTTRTTNASRQKQVKSMLETLNTTQTELKSLLSKKEDVSMTEAYALLENQQTIYQIVLDVSNRAISQSSLFEMLG
jgi:flagellar hook-associated protein 3 FlgL